MGKVPLLNTGSQSRLSCYLVLKDNTLIICVRFFFQSLSEAYSVDWRSLDNVDENHLYIIGTVNNTKVI